jgi:hypothetical protein
MKPQAIRLALILGLLASIAMSTTASAAERSTTANEVFGTVGVFGTWTVFKADWDVSKLYNGSTLEWRFTHVGMNATVERGMTCPGEICTEWKFAGNFKFYNAAGVQVGSTHNPPTGKCHTTAVLQGDRFFARCETTDFWMPLSATKVKFTWTVSVKRLDGLWLNPWSTTKTVTLS